MPHFIDHVPPNINLSNTRVDLLVFEDNEAVIQMIINGRSPNMRHVSRTHRVDLDWLIECVNLDPQHFHSSCHHEISSCVLSCEGFI